MGRLTGALQDLRSGFRALRRSPLYVVTAVLTLALGIALVTAAFSLVDRVMIRPLPYTDAGRLVYLGEADAQGRGTGVSYPNFLDWQHQDSAGAFSGIAYARGRGTSITRPEGAAQVLVAIVSPDFFAVVEPRLQLGRWFTPTEARDGSHFMVLTDAVWRGQFHADPHVVGTTVNTGDGDYTVAGVLARGAEFPEWAGIFIPVETVAATESVLHARDFHADSRTVARLKPRVPLSRGKAELDAIAHRLAAAYPAENAAWPSVFATPFTQYLRGSAPSNVAVLAAAMTLVLLIAWVNLTNLALVRAAGRTRELAIRTSLGASRGRIARQLLTEQLMLAAAAAVLGAFAATWVLGVIRGFAAGAPGSADVSIDGPALGFAALVAIVSALVVGALPAFRAAHVNLAAPLKEGAAGAGTGGRQQRIRGILVAGEIALALMLVIAAGLLVRSFWSLSHVAPGFNTHGLVAVDFSPPGKQYAEPAQAGAYYARVLDAVRPVPGVMSAAMTNHMPLNGAALSTTVGIPGRTVEPGHDPTVLFRTISPEYISTLGIPLRRGRNFTAADLTSGTAVMVNESFAKAFWPDQDAVGKSVLLHKSAQGYSDYGAPLPGVVVGVIGDVHHFGLANPPVPEIYIPYLRNPWGHMVLVARARTDAAA
ncbi:MAG: ABC transporter permease, partial [Gemmatimonadales bacterium]